MVVDCHTVSVLILARQLVEVLLASTRNFLRILCWKLMKGRGFRKTFHLTVTWMRTIRPVFHTSWILCARLNKRRTVNG